MGSSDGARDGEAKAKPAKAKASRPKLPAKKAGKKGKDKIKPKVWAKERGHELAMAAEQDWFGGISERAGRAGNESGLGRPRSALRQPCQSALARRARRSPTAIDPRRSPAYNRVDAA